MGTWFVLAQVNWIETFGIEKSSIKLEEKLGDLLWNSIEKSEKVIHDPFILRSIDSIVDRISNANDFQEDLLKIHVLENDEINAFVLPNGHLVIYSGLMLTMENQDEFSGVIAHEMAHIQLDHVMKKLIKEIGLSALITTTTGSSNSELIFESARLVSSTAFDRNLEKEADLKAVDYLVASRINPEGFATFLFNLGDQETEFSSYVNWISTHPESRERAAYIIEYSERMEADYEKILDATTWNKIKTRLEEASEVQ
ncbi:MAG: M48 family metallopeptidase [Lutimonas sp.]